MAGHFSPPTLPGYKAKCTVLMMKMPLCSHDALQYHWVFNAMLYSVIKIIYGPEVGNIAKCVVYRMGDVSIYALKSR